VECTQREREEAAAPSDFLPSFISTITHTISAVTCVIYGFQVACMLMVSDVIVIPDPSYMRITIWSLVTLCVPL